MIRWEAPGPYEVVFTTRLGGVSEGPYSSLNLGRMTGDDGDRVEENRRRACAAVGGDSGALALNRQVHGAGVNRAVAGGRAAAGDALWTDERALPIAALAADCVPIALARADGDRPAVAVVHAGWRGLLAGVVATAVSAVAKGRVAAALGPAVGPCCYEVGLDVAEPLRQCFGRRVLRGGKADLPGAAERALREAGCASVERVDLCTACHPELFFSHRRDGGVTGRQGVLGLVT